MPRQVPRHTDGSGRGRRHGRRVPHGRLRRGARPTPGRRWRRDARRDPRDGGRLLARRDGHRARRGAGRRPLAHALGRYGRGGDGPRQWAGADGRPHRPAGRHHPGDGGADRVGVAGRSALGGGRHGRKRHHRRWLGGGRGPERRVPGGAGDHGLLRRADALRRRRLRLRATEGRLIGPGPPADPAPGGSRGGVPAPFRRRRLGAAGRRRRRGLAGGLAALGAELGSGFDVVAGLTPASTTRSTASTSWSRRGPPRRHELRRQGGGRGPGPGRAGGDTAPGDRGGNRDRRRARGGARRGRRGGAHLVDRAWDDDDAFRRAGVLVEEATVEAARGALGATGAR